MTPAPLTAEALVAAQNAVTTEMLAAAWGAWHSRHGGKIGPGPAFVEAVAAAIAVSPLPAAETSLQRVTAERDEARADQKAAEDSNDALNEKLSALAPHGSCACSYDKPGDVCMHHSPALATATAEAARLRGEVEAKDRDHAVTALMVIALCNSVLGNAYLGKEGEEALAGHVKAAFIDPALAGAATEEGQADKAAPWPSGCIKPNACSRHRTCMYAQSAAACRHFGQDLTALIAQAEQEASRHDR